MWGVCHCIYSMTMLTPVHAVVQGTMYDTLYIQWVMYIHVFVYTNGSYGRCVGHTVYTTLTDGI